jgi:tRNA pseudouridine55 synthase
MDGAKIYRFTIAWGEERSTDDLEGPVTQRSDLRPDETAIRALLPKYTGIIMQTPPQFSAVKIAGARAYDLARDGETVEIPPREVEIGRFDLIGWDADGRTVFEIECGKGTYVRSLARDMGRDLGCFGHIWQLRRVEVEPFAVDELVTIDELEAARVPAELDETEDAADHDRFAAIDAYLVETAAALDCLPQVAVTDDAALRIRLGNSVIVRGRDAPVEAAEACATARGRLVAIGAIEAGMFKPKRVFAG